MGDAAVPGGPWATGRVPQQPQGSRQVEVGDLKGKLPLQLHKGKAPRPAPVAVEGIVRGALLWCEITGLGSRQVLSK